MLVIGGLCFRRLRGVGFSAVLVGSLGCRLGFGGRLVQLVVVENLLGYRIGSRVLRLGVPLGCLNG